MPSCGASRRGNPMKRREFITLLGGAAIAWPRSVVAQTPSKVYRVGLLSALAPPGDNSPFGAPLIRGLAKHGYTLGRNLVFERRGAEGRLDRLPRLVEEIVASKVDVIVPIGYPSALAAKQGTTIPLVTILAGDPVATGLVESLGAAGRQPHRRFRPGHGALRQAHGAAQGARAWAAPRGDAVERDRPRHDAALPGVGSRRQGNGHHRSAAGRARARRFRRRRSRP